MLFDSVLSLQEGGLYYVIWNTKKSRQDFHSDDLRWVLIIPTYNDKMFKSYSR